MRQREEPVLQDDPRRGKRVLCITLLPQISVYGTIKESIQQADGGEIWKVLTDHGVMLEGLREHFALYEYATAFQPGDRVKYCSDYLHLSHFRVLKAEYHPILSWPAIHWFVFAFCWETLAICGSPG